MNCQQAKDALALAEIQLETDRREYLASIDRVRVLLQAKRQACDDAPAVAFSPLDILNFQVETVSELVLDLESQIAALGVSPTAETPMGELPA